MRLRQEVDQSRYEEYRKLVCEPAPDVWKRIESIWEQAFCVYAAPSGTNARIDPLLDLTALIVKHLPDARAGLRKWLRHHNAQVAAYSLFGLSWSYDFLLPDSEIETAQEALLPRTESVRVMQGKAQKLVPLGTSTEYFCTTEVRLGMVPRRPSAGGTTGPGKLDNDRIAELRAQGKERVRLNARRIMKLIVEAPDDFWEQIFEIWADPRQGVPATLGLGSHRHPDCFMSVVPIADFTDAEEGLRRGLKHSSPIVVKRCVFGLSELYERGMPRRILEEISRLLQGREERVEIRCVRSIMHSGRLCDLLDHLPGSRPPPGPAGKPDSGQHREP